jgi:diguanylate cyclase (GGDEF)-like protein
MTREKEYLDRLSWQASHDALTGLANRREFECRLDQSLGSLAGQPKNNALMMLDLDQFKIVNDTCGHAAGDKLLRDVSALLRKCLRENDIVARLGGDEFGVLLRGCPIDEASQIAERLRTEIQKTIFISGGRSFNVSASIGLIALSTPHSTMEDALRRADIACYMAKEKGRNRVQFHQPTDSELQQRVSEMGWVQKIRDALEDDRFCLYAQRIVNVTADDPGAHVELLLRLRDENGALIPPNSFLPAAERFGLMPLIDRWVVENAFACLALRQTTLGERFATCGINLSASSIGDPKFTDYLHEQFSKHAIVPSHICFEITETGAINDLDAAARFIKTFQVLGCRFALDDFGTGMCSFGYLKRLPVDYLKIDGSFVKDMLTDSVDRAMVEMIVHMARTTGKLTVAEFVETEELFAALRAIGVDFAQGFAIEKPRMFSEIEMGHFNEWNSCAFSMVENNGRSNRISSSAA